MNIVSRRQWGARAPLGRPPMRGSAIRGVAVHYTGMNADEQSSHSNCAGRVRAIQRFHMDSNGWFDIAYNHVFCKHGVVFEGRGFGVRSAANGTAEGNDHYPAVCFLGDDTRTRDDLTPSGRRALVELIRLYRRKYPGARQVRPHSAFSQTACPGDELRRFIRTARWIPAWPIPIPRWFWAWARWRLRGRKGPRPRTAPRRIPAWAWRRLRALVAARRADSRQTQAANGGRIDPAHELTAGDEEDPQRRAS